MDCFTCFSTNATNAFSPRRENINNHNESNTNIVPTAPPLDEVADVIPAGETTQQAVLKNRIQGFIDVG